MALPDDGNRYEIVNGELVEMGNSGAKRGYIAIVLSSALFTVDIVSGFSLPVAELFQALSF